MMRCMAYSTGDDGSVRGAVQLSFLPHEFFTDIQHDPQLLWSIPNYNGGVTLSLR